MAKKTSLLHLAFIVIAMIVLSVSNMFVCRGEWESTWSSRPDEETVCEYNPCYGGPDCSKFSSDFVVDAKSGHLPFLELFWMKHASSSAVLISGWHGMSYDYGVGSYISKKLVKYIRKVHDIVGNAVTEGRYIIFGSGSTQLLNAAVYALSPNSSMSPTKVVATAPYFPTYRTQTQLFNSRDYIYEGDTSSWRKISNDTSRFIEFVTSPNNPDGKLTKGVLKGPNVKTIHDHAYYWPHFTAIPSPADEDLMLFTISKFTGHAGSRFGWAIIKDKEVFMNMLTYLQLNTMGVSHDSQLRVLKLLDVVLEGDGREIFQFAYTIMRERWIKMKQIISKSKRFSLQKLSTQYCTFFKRTRDPSPAFAWLKCERQEEKNCYEIFETVGIIGHQGSVYSVDNRYVRLSLGGRQDDFEILIKKLKNLVAKK